MYDYISACRYVCVHAAPVEANRGRRLLPPLPQVELKQLWAAGRVVVLGNSSKCSHLLSHFSSPRFEFCYLFSYRKWQMCKKSRESKMWAHTAAATQLQQLTAQGQLPFLLPNYPKQFLKKICSCYCLMLCRYILLFLTMCWCMFVWLCTCEVRGTRFPRAESQAAICQLTWVLEIGLKSELTMSSRLASNFLSSCFALPSTGRADVYHHVYLCTIMCTIMSRKLTNILSECHYLYL